MNKKTVAVVTGVTAYIAVCFGVAIYTNRKVNKMVFKLLDEQITARKALEEAVPTAEPTSV